MPLYMIERTFAEQLDLTSDDVRLIDEINADEGVHWLFSFLSADRRRTYCLYEAPSPEAVRGGRASARTSRSTPWSRSARPRSSCRAAAARLGRVQRRRVAARDRHAPAGVHGARSPFVS